MRGHELSAAERANIELMVEGLTTKEIGLARGVSPKTVRAQLINAYFKLGARNAAHAAYLWCKREAGA